MTQSKPFLLSVKEASEYFNIGLNKLYRKRGSLRRVFLYNTELFKANDQKGTFRRNSE